NTGAAPVQGRFAQATTISLPGYAFEIDYAGGDGNDVVLKLVAAPAPGGGGRVAAVPTLGEWSLLLLGLLAAGLGARRLRRAGWRAAGGRSGAREGGCY
ncbi:MAG: IPTL-CTERM sorting domain-containing protein, partial [Ottowia sp.]|nr:IPTL-CTERM sorting domain-containing protein [Ottowia sp.]